MEDEKKNNAGSSDNENNEPNDSEKKAGDKPKEPSYKVYDWIQTDLLAKQDYADIVKQTGEWLESDPKFREYYKEYNETSWKSFINSYSNKKANWIVYGARNLKWQENSLLQYRLDAEDRLWHIQQKKLFNMQCLWRAEQIEIPGLSVTKEFDYWEEHIRVCPFLEPITDDEFAMYLAFFDSPGYDEKEHYHNWIGWQNYEDFKKENSTDPDSDVEFTYPEWYFWWDSRRGTSGLLELPDIRGEKEWEYFKDGMDYKKILKPYIPNPNADTRKFLDYSDAQIIEDFAKKFDDPKLLKYVRAMEYNRINPRSDSHFDLILEELKEIDEDISTGPADDWRIAVENAYFGYVHNKVRDELENSYMDYISNLKMGIAFNDKEQLYKQDYKLHTVEWWKEAILLGRKSRGEPEDFNF